MRDFKGFVRQHLASLALPRARELKIVEELSAQIEESYDALIAEGLSDEEAWNEVQRHIPDWKTFGDELLETEPAAPRDSPSLNTVRRASGRESAIVLARLATIVGSGSSGTCGRASDSCSKPAALPRRPR